MHWKVLLSCLLVGFAADTGTAAPLPTTREYSHRVWRVQDGLPQNRIQALAQTPDGYLWIGTSGGLARYDGARFFVYDRSNTPEFRDDSILAIEVSHDGSLWIGTEGGGMLHYRGGKFEVFDEAHGLTNSFVRALHEDTTGALWIGTDRGFFRRIRGKIERLDDRGNIPITAITNLYEDSQKRVWAVGGIGLLVFEGGVLRLARPESELVEGVGGVLETRDGNRLLLNQTGIWRLENGKFRQHRVLGDMIPLNLTEDREGNLWVGTLGAGLLRIDAKGDSVPFRHPDMLPDNSVFCTLADREGNLWVGTQDGLLRLNRTPIRTFSAIDGIADQNISTVYKDRDESLWIVTVTGEIYRHINGKIQRYHLAALDGSRPRLVFRDSKNVLWFGTNDRGLFRVENGKTTNLAMKQGLRTNVTRQIFEDSRGDLWIALGSGLSRWDGKQFQNYYTQDGLAYGSVRLVREDRNGDILVGSERGLNRIHNGKFVKDPAFDQLNGLRVWTMHQDSDGTMWIGTRGAGLFRYKNGKMAALTTAEGLLSNAIYSIVDDGRGTFWISTPGGVFSVPRRELDRVAEKRAARIAIVPYGTSDGLDSAQMNGGLGDSAARTSSGELWFPSVKGLVRINPSEARLTQPSSVLIENISADDKAVALTKDATIPPGHGKLKIEYTASSLISPERVSFEYKLEGFDDAWTPASNQRIAYYTNLPPGRYKFRVVARDSASSQGVSEASFPFIWEPHFYETYWFYALCAALVALCAWAVFRFYVQQAKARYALLLAERTRLAREMHDTVIQGCVGVSTLLEAASGFQEEDAERALGLVDQARVQVRSTLDEARQAVWDLRHDRLDGNIAETLRDLGRQLSAEKGIPIEVQFMGSPCEMDQMSARSMLLVAREAIRNAANHALPRHITMRMYFEPREVRLEVVDDGCGFTVSAENSEATGHYGLLGMRERIEQFGGSFLVRSKPGEGTSVVARLPLRAV